MRYTSIIAAMLLLCSVTASSQTQKFKETLAQAYNTGDPATQYKVGEMYREGKEVNEDILEAMKWYKRAARQGNTQAAKEAAYLYFCGVGNQHGKMLDRDYKEALRLYHFALKDYPKDAYYNMAYIYADGGNGVAMDKEKGFSYMKQAVESGSGYAANIVGRAYLYGPADEWNYKTFRQQKNVMEAEKWLKKGAELNDQSCMMLLGSLYYEGTVLPRNYNNSFMYFSTLARKASGLNLANALNMLSYHYAQGCGVQKNMRLAHESIDKAIEMFPNEPTYYDSKGEFYLMQGDKVNARRMYDKCVQLKSDWGSYRTPLYIGLFGN